MPARHTMECPKGHKWEGRFSQHTSLSKACPQCGEESEILWESTPSEYQIRKGIIDWL